MDGSSDDLDGGSHGRIEVRRRRRWMRLATEKLRGGGGDGGVDMEGYLVH